MTLDFQDILATIDRNQAQIDLLTANNTQLVRYLLRMGAEVNHQQLSRFSEDNRQNGHHVPPPPKQPRIQEPQQLALPAPKRGRGRPRVEGTILERGAALLNKAGDRRGFYERTPETIAKQKTAQMVTKQSRTYERTPEDRSKMSVAIQRAHDEGRIRRPEWTPEMRAQKSASMKKLWAEKGVSAFFPRGKPGSTPVAELPPVAERMTEFVIPKRR